MEYRELGKTGLKASAIGLGCAMLGSSNTGYGVEIVQRALELGINFLDVARGYRDAEIKVGLGVEGQREKAIISTKTGAVTREEAWREINESLERLRTDYLDNCHLHGLVSSQDIQQRLGPGGALEALIEARAQGMVRHIGCTSHRSVILVEALNRFDFEIVLVPMNIVEREPLDALIPLCHRRGIGVTIMKPLATGLLPAPLALKWALGQPIAAAVPGCTTLEELDENARVGGNWTLSPVEQEEVHRLKEKLEHVRCRVCHLCEPCPQGLSIGITLGTDIMYDHYRTMGRQGFRAFCWSREAVERDLPRRQEKVALIERCLAESCPGCGMCEARCPYGLPIVEMLRSVVPAMEDMLHIYAQLLDAL